MLNFLRRNLILIVLLLTVATSALTVYALTQIQDSRVQLCQEANTRHAHSVAALTTILAKSLKLPASTTQAQLTSALQTGKGVHVPRRDETLTQVRTSYQQTVFLIDALAPYHDCNHL
jgi:C4-dicarboxylate-specific signal transduction histidine kinase